MDPKGTNLLECYMFFFMSRNNVCTKTVIFIPFFDSIIAAGHQKKLMLAVKKLAELQRLTDGRGSPRKKPPPITQQQELMSIDSPPPEGK